VTNSTILLYILPSKRRETLAPPFATVFKTDPTLVVYKILEIPFSLRGINTLLDKCILSRPLIDTLCGKAPKVYIDLINK
jgi:hypothetical protein